MMNHYYDNIEGWFDFQDIYSDMVKQFDNESIFVEVGTWLGRSIVYLGVEVHNSQKNIKIYGVDNFNGSPGETAEHGQPTAMSFYINAYSAEQARQQFLTNIEPLKSIITPLLMDSDQAVQQFADKSIDFCFIDSDHSYASISKEIDLWLPKIKPGGYIGGHDYHYISVTKAVSERFTNFKTYTTPMATTWLTQLPIS